MHFSGPNAFIGNGMSESSGNRFFSLDQFRENLQLKIQMLNIDVDAILLCSN